MGMLVPQEGYFVVTFISVTVVLFFFFFKLELLCNSYNYKSFLISFQCLKIPPICPLL